MEGARSIVRMTGRVASKWLLAKVFSRCLVATGIEPDVPGRTAAWPAGLLCLGLIAGCGGGSTSASQASSSSSSTSYTVGGTLVGLASGQQITLADNGADALVLNAAGAFSFSERIASGASYSITVPAQPSSATCVVSNASGTNITANVTSVLVTCSPSTPTIGGTLSGLAADDQITLHDNGGDSLTLSANGVFTFATPIAGGDDYAVTVAAQPDGQDCTVTNGSGIVGTTNLTSVNVSCVSSTAGDALSLFASSWSAIEITRSLGDLAPVINNTWNGCAGSGTSAYADAIESLNDCVPDFMVFPANYAYTGSYATSVSDNWVMQISNIYSLQATSQVASQVTSLPNFVVTSGGGFSYHLGIGTTSYPITFTTSGAMTINGGSLSYSLGTNSYTLSPTATALTYASNQLSIVEDDFDYDENSHGQPANAVSVNATIQIPSAEGAGGYPSSGAYVVVNGDSSSSCATLNVSFISPTQFTLSCGGQTYTKNWIDPDVAAAFVALTN
jgi:hypothetical protein